MARLRVLVGARPGFAGLGINGIYYQSGTTIELDESEFVGEFEVYKDLLTIERVEAGEGQAEPASTPEPAKKSARRARK